MGGKTISTEAPKIANISLQSSSYGLALPVIFGTTRVAANLIWYGNFTPIAHTTSSSSGGKGLGKVTSKNTTYTYTASAMLGLCEGPIAGIGNVWKDKDQTTLAALGLSLFSGTADQPVWSFLAGYNVIGNWGYDLAYGYQGTGAAFTDQAINYSSTAYVAASAYDLGDSGAIPNHSFEVQGQAIYAGGAGDANPADIVPLMLCSPQYGAGMPPAMLGDLSLYSTYCQASGILVSPAYTDQAPAADRLSELATITNSGVVWSGGLLKMVPYGDMALTGNGVTYTPNLTPLFDFADDDFQNVSGDDPVRVTRSTPADAYNRIQIEFLNRANQYNVEVASTEDQEAVELYGLRTASTAQMHMICDSSTAKLVAQLGLQRSLYIRNQYEFDLDARYPMLEPMDIVTLTDAGLGMARLPVRIISVEEQDSGYLVTAEDLPIGTASAARYAHDNGLHWQSIINTSPQNAAAPTVFELPYDSSTTGLSVGIATGAQAGDLLYGGCRVWLSLDGNNYKSSAIIYGSSRYGALTAALPQHAPGTDTADTLSLALASGGQIISGSAADVAKGTTLIWVGGEYLAYQNATLTGPGAYALTPLNRGLYATTPVAHGSGTAFVRVDDAIGTLHGLDPALIGQTIHIKLTAFNTYAAGEQDLSAVPAYTYTINGALFLLGAPVDYNDTGLVDSFNYPTTAAFDRAWTNGLIDGPASHNGERVIVATADKGGSAIQIGNNAGDDFSQGFYNSTIPFDPEDLYVCQFDVEFVHSTTASFYAGVAAFNAAGVNLASDSGAYCYVSAAGASNLDGQRRTYIGYFRGRAAVGASNGVGVTGGTADAPVPLPNTTVDVAPMFLANYAPGQSGQIILHGMSCRRVDDITVNPTGAWVSTRSYFRNDGVSYLGRSFASRADGNLNNTPPTTAASNASWFLIADKGADGAPAKSLSISSDRQTIAYDGTGAINPATQTTTFTATVQNSAATVTWSMTGLDGSARTAATYLSATTGSTVTMTASAFDAALAGSGGVIVIATIVDGTTLVDEISVTKIKSGTNGVNGLLNAVEVDTIDTITSGGGGSYAMIASGAMYVPTAAVSFTLILDAATQRGAVAGSSASNYYVDAVVPGVGVVQVSSVINSSTMTTTVDGEGVANGGDGTVLAIVTATGITLPFSTITKVIFRLWGKRTTASGTPTSVDTFGVFRVEAR